MIEITVATLGCPVRSISSYVAIVTSDDIIAAISGFTKFLTKVGLIPTHFITKQKLKNAITKYAARVPMGAP